MIKHVVMYKLKDKADAKPMVDALLSMRGKIDILRGITAGCDFLGSGRSYDVCLICEFESKADLDAYAVHPVHVPVKSYIGTVIESAVSVDFEV